MKKNNNTVKTLEILRNNYFLNPEGLNIDKIILLVKTAVETVIAAQGDSAIYPINKGIPAINEIVSTAEIPSNLTLKPEKYLQLLPTLVQGTVKAGHPYMVKNLIPTASIPALATYFVASLYMPNGVSGEDAAQILLAEIACASAISKLAGINPNLSAGVFTFGGTGTNLYAIKIALSKLFPEHHAQGLKEDVAIIESAPSHYSHKTAVNWLGIGQNNLIKISSNLDQTTNLNELEEKCAQTLSSGKKLACIIAVGGTTSNLGIDNIKNIYNIREKLVKQYNLTYKPHIHVDSVLGWAFLSFKSYDFQKNPLRFKQETLKKIKKIMDRVLTFKYADSFGIDFHKTGYVAYNSSMIIVKDRFDLMRLQRDVSIMTPLFHDDEAYNPGKFTLETSRSAANILATWIALQTFGQEGYQALLGHALEMGIVFREEIAKNASKGFYVANQEQYGPDVFVRCYEPSLNSEEEYKAELRENSLLKKNNEYTSKFFKWIYKYQKNQTCDFAISKSSAAIYTHTGEPMVALRIYPLSPYITERTAKELVNRLVNLKLKFDSQIR